MLPTFKRVLYDQTDEFLFHAVFGYTAVFHDDGVLRTIVGFCISIKFLFDMSLNRKPRTFPFLDLIYPISYSLPFTEKSKSYFLVSV